jgi:hypothetical protein
MGGLGVGAYALASPAGASPSVVPTIASVAFSSGASVNSPSALVTINGSGFGTLPHPSPGRDPATLPEGCGAVSGYDGLDFGANLYFNNLSSPGFEAGNGQDFNCVGLVIWKYTPTQIEYGFGSTYVNYSPWHLQNGNAYSLHVKGASVSGTVTFTS